ncbi:CAP domain-containing protein [Phyllobacterium sp. 21LDTY02-6]|jgi:uncharacterized protein YkwD|uniref:CAP domain-containing protein n=1 Tax=unclassified Phyllobacterium TaxID=2638441 RepID=UPI002020DC42|nr:MULTISPECIES: CAP domain-containing protein [unclassified Phyllobacterium]MCO4318787.1 CAP domain-containing protein [Phyllobacterium sp. 21LDTY02-6]MCX8281946.1 CAP domain-containing protein [Phyllobacterium sp. 0TCS1.6C]MCX8294409.1 CAP domain-containing protein [Phyllobacterium sp. 0TCS1.6A]
MPAIHSVLRPRRHLHWALLALLLPLAACQSAGRGPGASAGVSGSASGAMAAVRSGNGLESMSPDSRLEQAALQQAIYMASRGRMTHTTGWGRDFATRVGGNGIDGAAAENIAMGRMGIDRLFAMWMASPPHRRNMLDPRFRHYGLAYAEAANGSSERYWALVLGR